MVDDHLPALQHKIAEAAARSASSGEAASALDGAAVGLGAGYGLSGAGAVAAVAVESVALGLFAAPAMVLFGVGALACAYNAADARDNEKTAAKRAVQLAKQQADEIRNLQLAAKEVESLQALLAVLGPTAPYTSESPGPAEVATKLGTLVCELVCLVQQTHVSLVESLTRAAGSSSRCCGSSIAADRQKVVSELGDLLTEVRIADSRWRTGISDMAAGLAATAGVEAEGLLETFLKSSEKYLNSKLSITPATAQLLLEDVKPMPTGRPC